MGEYRSAGSLVVHGMDGRDAKAEQALAMKGSFPGNDVALAAYVAGIGARMKPYAVKLAARGFSKEKQAELVVAGVAFAKAFAAVGKLRGEARSSTLARGAVFKELRTNTAYFRKAGREALKSVVARADFDRVKPSGGRGAAVVALPKQEAAAS